MKELTIYTRNDPPCGYCVMAKTLLRHHGINFKEVIIGEDIDKEEFRNKFPNIRTVPAIFSEEYIGGYTQLEQRIAEYSNG